MTEKNCYNCGNKNCHIFYATVKQDVEKHHETYEYIDFDCVKHDKWEKFSGSTRMAENKETWGGKRLNAGRKKKYDGGRQQLAISCSIAQKEAIQTAAKNTGLTTAEYILQKCGVSDL